jgi:hypothetical protein
MTTLSYTEVLTVVHCTCGIAFAIPVDLNQQLLDHRSGPGRKSVYCPLGHSWHYTGKTDAEREKEARLAAERREQAVRDLLSQEERSHSATKGQLTKTKKRVANGVCPFCNRSFTNVQRHMASKHPEECAHA